MSFMDGLYGVLLSGVKIAYKFGTFKKMFQQITFDSQKPEVLDRKWKEKSLLEIKFGQF